MTEVGIVFARMSFIERVFIRFKGRSPSCSRTRSLSILHTVQEVSRSLFISIVLQAFGSDKPYKRTRLVVKLSKRFKSIVDKHKSELDYRGLDLHKTVQDLHKILHFPFLSSSDPLAVLPSTSGISHNNSGRTSYRESRHSYLGYITARWVLLGPLKSGTGHDRFEPSIGPITKEVIPLYRT